MDLYICHTYYHVLISSIKALQSTNESEIYICATIPTALSLLDQIKETHIFQSVYFFDESNLNIKNKYRLPISWLENNIFISQREKKKLPSKLKNYSNIYIFNDCNNIGRMLSLSRIKYHLVEDALDSYYYLDNYVTINRKNLFLKRLFNYNMPYGNSKYVIDVEVNNRDKIGSLVHKNIIEYPRSKLFGSLTDKQKQSIFSMFIKSNFTLANSSNAAILLTQPLFMDKIVASEIDQIKIYKNIIKSFLGDFDTIIIKPHPRDSVSYFNISQNIVIVESSIPIEILNFNTSLNIDSAITISSSSINGIDFVKNKTTLGFEWLQRQL